MLLVLVAGMFARSASAQSAPAPEENPTQKQHQEKGQAAVAPAVNQAIDRIIARERQEIVNIRRYNPIIETYIQDVTPEGKAGTVPVHDHYFLGQAELSKGVVENPLINKNKKKHDAVSPISHLSGMFGSSYVPEGFLQMVFIDAN